MTCACATTPDDCCGCCCCAEGDAPSSPNAPVTDAPPPTPLVARTGEQLYPVQPTPKETKNKGELLVAVTSKPGLQLKNQGEILVPTTVKPALVLKNQGVQLSPVVTKGPNAEPVGEYIAPTRPLAMMETPKKGREAMRRQELTTASPQASDDALLLLTLSAAQAKSLGLPSDDPRRGLPPVDGGKHAANPRKPDSRMLEAQELQLLLSTIAPSVRLSAPALSSGSR